MELAANVVGEPIWKFSVHSARGAFVGCRFDEEDMHASVLDRAISVMQFAMSASARSAWPPSDCAAA
jgi:hypothetical protein